MYYLEFHGELECEQNGFRKKQGIRRSYLHIPCGESQITRGKNMFACFVDFKKAFDWINRDLLEYKLICSGINVKF